MTERSDYYKYYKKVQQTTLDKLIADSSEFYLLAERYPHLAESIRLKRVRERLKHTAQSDNQRSMRFQAQREIRKIDMQLR